MSVWVHFLYIVKWFQALCDVVCYRERKREINSPTLLCLNQQSLRLTAKTVGEWWSVLRTPWPAACWTKNGIQVIRVSWRDPMVGEEKSQMIGYRTFSAEMIPFCQRKLGNESLIWEEKSAWKDMVTYSQSPGGPSPAKRIYSSGQTLAKERGQFRQLRGCH